MSRFLPPSKVLDAEVSESIIGDGCLIRANAKITHSVIGLRALICASCLPLPSPSFSSCISGTSSLTMAGSALMSHPS